MRLPLSALLLAPAILAAAAFAEAPPPRHSTRLLVINDDGFSAFYSGRYKNAADLRAHVLTYRDTPLAIFEWCITSGSRVNYPSKVTELIGTGITDFGRRGDQLATETLQRLAAEGTDTLATVAAACREAGLLCYATMRMNGDYASKPGDDFVARQFNSDFWRAHPEFRIRGLKGEDRTKLSYAFPEVRAFKLAILREAAERDIDGIHLDFLRHPPFFGHETPLVDAFQKKYAADPRTLPTDDPRWFTLRAEFMTGFLRDVRTLLDEAGKKKGRRLGLSARIDWREHLKVGCDVATWLRAGLLDYLAVGQHSLGGYEIDLKPFVAMAAGTGCAMLYAEEAILSGHDRTAAEDRAIAAGQMAPPKRDRLSLADYRARAARWYAAGAHGLHLFNEADPAILRGLGSVEATKP
ncbi:MAG: family 10 glycosylhydrolase [Verrucomicrobia bacterium]|nr:family 10 glycosylhydrolase [Verrucomicrobiota bacterium]